MPPVVPVSRANMTCPFLLHTGIPASIVSGDMVNQLFQELINDGMDNKAQSGASPAIPILVPLCTLQESFKEVTFYRAYQLLGMRHSLSFNDITRMSELGSSIQSFLPQVNSFSGIESITFLRFFRDFKLSCHNLDVHAGAAVRLPVHLPTTGAYRLY